MDRKLAFPLLILSFIIACWQLFFMPLRTIWVIIPVGLLGLGYIFPVIPTLNGWKRLRDFYWLKVLWIAFAFSWLTTFLPVIYTDSQQARHFISLLSPSVIFIFLRSFLFISALCIPFDIRDVNFDKMRGMKTLPVIAGIKKSVLIAVALLCVFMLLVVFQHFRFGFGGHETIALLLSGSIAMIAVSLANPERPKLLFPIMYDGAMLLQWGLVLLFIHL